MQNNLQQAAELLAQAAELLYDENTHIANVALAQLDDVRITLQNELNEDD